MDLTIRVIDHCSIFAERRPSDCMCDSDNVNVRYSYWTERSAHRDNAFFTRSITSPLDNIRSSNCISKKNLSVSNVKFLQSLGFAVRNFWDDCYLEYYRWADLSWQSHHKIETHTYNPFANITFGYSDEIRISYSNKICTRYRAKVFFTSKEYWRWKRKTIRCL